MWSHIFMKKNYAENRLQKNIIYSKISIKIAKIAVFCGFCRFLNKTGSTFLNHINIFDPNIPTEIYAKIVI